MIEEFKSLLKNIKNPENKKRINEILHYCLTNRKYITNKECHEIIYHWFIHSIQHIIVYPGIFLTLDEYHDIYEYFLRQLYPPYKPYDSKKSKPTSFLSHILKLAILNYLRKKYRTKSSILFSEFPENFDIATTQSISKNTLKFLYDKFTSFLKSQNLTHNKTFNEFEYEILQFCQNEKIKFKNLSQFLFDFFQIPFKRTLYYKWRKFIKNANNITKEANNNDNKP